MAVVGGKRVGFSGGGALGALVLGATAGRLWPASAKKAVQANVNATWLYLQPALFGLLGGIALRRAHLGRRRLRLRLVLGLAADPATQHRVELVEDDGREGGEDDQLQ